MKYKIEKLLGEGKFGMVYKGWNIRSQQPVAIKLEKGDIRLLKHETTILHYLHSKGVRNIPMILWYGIYADQFPCLIMPFYKCSLLDLSLKLDALTLSYVMQNMLSILENIHGHGVIHRDIKPQNFMMSSGAMTDICLIDFGLATYYMEDHKTHIPMEKHREHILGTPKYISLYVHEGIAPSRRDDLISLGYVFMYLKYGGLPWDGIPEGDNNTLSPTHVSHRRNQIIKMAKERVKEEMETHEGGDLDAMEKRCVQYWQYCNRLEFDTTPNYGALIRLFSLDS